MSKPLEKKEKLVELSLVGFDAANRRDYAINLDELSQQLNNDLRQIGTYIRDQLAIHGNKVRLQAKAARPGFSDTRSLSRAADSGNIVSLRMYTFRPSSADDVIHLVSNGVELSMDDDIQLQLPVSWKQPRPHARLILTGWVPDDPDHQQCIDLILHPKSATAHVGKAY